MGLDTNNGTNTCTPWKTLSKVNTVTLNAGNKIFLKRGNTFYGSLNSRFSGASGSPITYGAYGTGANPVITGFSTINGWMNVGNNIWETNVAVSNTNMLNMVVISGVNTAMGRFPNANAANAGYLTFQSHIGTTSITSSSLSGTPNWTGAEVVIRNGNFMLERSLITTHSGGTLNFNPGTVYENRDGYGFFIQNDPRTLDQQGEWYYNPSTKKLRIYSVSAPSNVQVPTVETLFSNSGNFVVLDSIDFIGSNGTTITSRGSSITIKNCNVSFSGVDYLSGSGSDQIITDNTFLNANNNGVSVDGSRIQIARNTLRNTGTFQGMGQSRGYGINGALSFGGAGARDYVVEANQVFNSGLNGIVFYADNVVVKNNFIDTFGFLLDDGAGIYTYTGNRTLLTNVKIDSNIIINGIGAPQGTANPFPAAGIYTDEQSNGIEISGNSIAHTFKYGIFHNISANINVHDNTVFDASAYLLGSGWSTNITSNRNTFVSKAGQYTAFISAGTNDIPRNFVSDNNIYARPVDDLGKLFHISQPSEGGRENKSLAEWKAFSGRDANTRGTPIFAASDSDIVFEYNATLTPKTIPLSTPMMSMNGTRYSGSITLQPFTSVVLIKSP